MPVVDMTKIDTALVTYRNVAQKYNSILGTDDLTPEGKQTELEKLHEAMKEMKTQVTADYQEEVKKAQLAIDGLSESEEFPQVDEGERETLAHHANVIQSRFSMINGSRTSFNKFVSDILESERDVRQAFVDIAHKLKPEAQINALNLDSAYEKIKSSLKSDEQLKKDELAVQITRDRSNLTAKHIAFNRNIDQLIAKTGLKFWGKEPVKQKSNSLW